MNFGQSLGLIAPFYNLIFAFFVAYFFIMLFSTSTHKELVKPWKILCAAFSIYVVEELFTLLRKLGIIDLPRVFNGLFEMLMILLFIYMILTEHHRFTKNTWTIVKSPKRHHRHFKWKKAIDKGIYIVALLSPLTIFPQIVKVYVQQQTAGVSIVSWGFFLASASFWLVYGILHKEKPIIVSNSLWICLEVILITGLVIY